MSDVLHLTGIPPFKQIEFGLVSKFPLNYMHLVCLGVVKRLLILWVKGPFDGCRIGASFVRCISEPLLNMCKFLPHEFLRKGQSLFDVNRWKASEFSHFYSILVPLFYVMF